MKISTTVTPNEKFTPQKDFYKYVNHKWLKEHPTPDSESRWGTFDVLRDKTEKQLRAICEETQADKKAPKGSNTQIIRDFYASGMDMEKRNRKGIAPIRDLLDEIEGIQTFEDAVQMIAKLQRIGIHPFFDMGVDKDVKDPDNAALYISQGGLGMPDRDYYLEETPDMQKIRDSYMAYMNTVLSLAGYTKAQAKTVSKKVYGVELKLAKCSRTRELVREIDKNYEKYSISKAEKEFKIFGKEFVSAIGGGHLVDFIIQQPEFLKEVEKILQEDLDIVKLYLKWRVLTKSASFLSKEFNTAHFNFYGKTIQGLKEQKPVWKRVIQVMQGGYGSPLTEALGPLYVAKYFSPQAKIMLYGMIETIKTSFKKRVRNLAWMDESTKKLVYKKVNKITFKLGYPDKWEDVSEIGVGTISFIQNYFKVLSYEFDKKIKEAGGPANWDEWVMKATIVNACADQMREMTFPAAFFQDEFFDPKADMATNYGSAGSVMGHELSHFVDDQGCKFDANGKLNDWWPEKVKEAYQRGAKAFVEHYGNYSVDGVPVNGEFTQGENIGDVAGLMIAYDALQQYIHETGDDKSIRGLTPDQRFFIGFAKVDCGHMRLERRKDSYKTDPHAPGEVRVNAAVSIIPAFVAAFEIKKGDPMYIDPKSFPNLW
jgi:putative endopeptidase